MLPRQLQDILINLKSQEWIQKLAHNAEVYVVGGSVRDAFIEKPIKDIDLVVDGLSFSGIQKILKPYGKQSLVGESFSVIKFMPEGHVGEDYDIAVPREDRKVGKGHKGFEIVTEGVDIMGDLKRRDFTINSIAVNVMSGEIIDPFNGRKDLINKKIKATDEKAFIEDPLRILRGIQFASRFNFDIDQNTMKMMKDNAHLVKEITGERILEEFQKIINKGNTQIALKLLHQTDVDKALFDKKMLQYDEGFDYLDAPSFYYMLALIGDVDPYTFYMKRLKGNVEIGKAIKTLDDIITKWDGLSEEDKKYLVMMSIKKSPLIGDSALIPSDMEEIILDMRTKKIPSSPSDILINGDEIQKIFGIPKGKKIGDILERIHKDALMNKFNWKDRISTLEYVSNFKV